MAFKIRNDVGVFKNKDRLIKVDELIDEIPKQHPVIADHHLNWVFL